jgi:hypothetical protein
MIIYVLHKKLSKFFIHQASDRMAMLLTILLISTTIYGGVEAPPQRGMSYIEIWIIGMQIPTLIAIFETGYALLQYRRQKTLQESVLTMDVNENTSKSVDIRLYDIATGGILIAYFLLFQIIYWMVALTL